MICFQNQIEIYAFQGNEYRKTPYKVKRQKICDYVTNDKFFYPSLQKHSEFPEKCPIKKGSYKVELSPDFSSLPRNFQGRFMLRMESFLFGKASDNTSIYFEIERYSELES